MKLWRITNKGSWPEFDVDVIGDTISEALNEFDKRQKGTGSMANRKQVIAVQLIGDTEK